VIRAGLTSLALVCAVGATIRVDAASQPEQAPAAAPSGRAAPRAVVSAQPPSGPGALALTPAWRAFSAGDLDRAAVLAREALKRNPADTKARLVLARVAMERGDAEGAFAELRQARQRTPDDPDVLYYLAIVSGDLARGAFDALYQLAPESAPVHLLMAESFESQDKRAEAESEYNAALQADPNLVDALLGLAKLKRIRLACDEAIALYEKAEAIRLTFDGAFGLGTCLAVQQEDEKAIVQFKRALAGDQRAAVAWEGLGTALARTGKVAEGIAALERAIALEPDMSEAYYALGQAYRKAGNEERARAAFDHAQRLRTAEPR
jgi:tetratricopeptide (TPR) repeat protein